MGSGREIGGDAGDGAGDSVCGILGRARIASCIECVFEYTWAAGWGVAGTGDGDCICSRGTPKRRTAPGSDSLGGVDGCTKGRLLMAVGGVMFGETVWEGGASPGCGEGVQPSCGPWSGRAACRMVLAGGSQAVPGARGTIGAWANSCRSGCRQPPWVIGLLL